MIHHPVSEIYTPPSGHSVSDTPENEHYQRWGYSVAMETNDDGKPTPENGNTCIFRIHPGGSTEPVLVTKKDPESTFKIEVLSGEGIVVAVDKDGEVFNCQISKEQGFTVRPGMAYMYHNASDREPLVLRDEAVPAYASGDDVEITSSRVTSGTPEPKPGYLTSVVETGNCELMAVELPEEFWDAAGKDAMSYLPAEN